MRIKLTFGLPAPYLTEMEALIPTDNSFQKAFLFFSRYDLIFPVNMTLVARELVRQDLNEVRQRKVLVLVDIHKLLFKDSIVMARSGMTQYVQNCFFPRASRESIIQHEEGDEVKRPVCTRTQLTQLFARLCPSSPDITMPSVQSM